jgi:hypothetical protein
MVRDDGGGAMLGEGQLRVTVQIFIELLGLDQQLLVG